MFQNRAAPPQQPVRVPTPGLPARPAQSAQPAADPTLGVRPAPAEYAQMAGGAPEFEPEPQAAYQAPPAVDIPPHTVVLDHPVSAHGEEVRHVRFRKPTTKDLRIAGYPMRNVLGADGRVTAIEELPDVVAKYVSLLSEPPLPPSSVNSMDIDDFSKCSGAVLAFFLG